MSDLLTFFSCADADDCEFSTLKSLRNIYALFARVCHDTCTLLIFSI
jgi:hypothetical protein